MNHDIIIIEDLADALHAHDLARVRTFPSALLCRRDACVPYYYRGSSSSEEPGMLAAPLACAIEYALETPFFDPKDPRRALLAVVIEDTPAFKVFDWFLERFTKEELIDAPLESTDTNAAPSPLRRTIDALTRFSTHQPLALLARLLQRGAALRAEANGSYLLYALDLGALPAGARAIRMLIDAGARLAPGEAPQAVRRCVMAMPSPQPQQREMIHKVAAVLRTLLPLLRAPRGLPAGQGVAYGERSGIFENIQEQESAATAWLRDTDASLGVLDALRLLGLRMDVARRVALGLAAHHHKSQSAEEDAYDEAARAVALRRADHASGERAMRTLAVRALRERLPLDIVSDIARRASADAPSWQLALGPMDPPLSLLRSGSGSAAAAAIAAADARALAEGERRAYYGAP